MLGKMLARISTAEKISLLKDALSLDSDISISSTAKQDVFRFGFYGQTASYRAESILKNKDKFKNHLSAKIESAKKIYEETNTVAEILAEEKEFDITEFYLDSLPNADTEEEVAEIFEHNHQSFKEFWASPDRNKLDQTTRGFLMQLVSNPFQPLWEDTE